MSFTLWPLSTHCKYVQVDQAALTGESLPVKKYSNDVCFSGSTIKQGEKHAIVYATGANTFFGRAAALIGATNNVANLQKIMTKIGGTCLITIGVWIIIELCVQFGHYRHACAGGESKLLSDSCTCLCSCLLLALDTSSAACSWSYALAFSDSSEAS